MFHIKSAKKSCKKNRFNEAISEILHRLKKAGMLKEEIVLEEEIVFLHALIDGLALHILMGLVPIERERIRYLLRKELDRIFVE